MPGAIDASLCKFHTSLNVSALDRSIAFYRALLGVEPAKVRADYAKFELAEPPLVLSLIPGRPQPGGHLNHAGLRVKSAEELVEIQRRLEAAGMPTRREDNVECCYARQTKFWAADPDGALWEIYVFHEDVDAEDDDHDHQPVSGSVAMAMQPPAPAAVQSWAHRIRDEVPSRVPHDDNTLHEIHLEGTFNLPPETPNRAGLLSEALRCLRPGAAISLRGLAGDRTCPGPVSLPGPAAAVTYVPSSSDVTDELARAGFVDIRIEKLSETAYFVVEGISLRELRIVARKPGYRPAAQRHRAVYLGPLREVVDDYGTVFRRGVPTEVNIHDWQLLANNGASGSFLLLKPEDVKAEGCCGEPEAQPVTLSGRGLKGV